MDREEAYRDAEDYILLGVNNIKTTKRALYYAHKTGYDGKPVVDENMEISQENTIYRGLIENSKSDFAAIQFFNDLAFGDLRYNTNQSIHGGKALYYSSSFDNAAKHANPFFDTDIKAPERSGIVLFARLNQSVYKTLDDIRSMIDNAQNYGLISARLAAYYKTIGMQEFAALNGIDFVINGMTYAVYNRTKLIVGGYERV